MIVSIHHKGLRRLWLDDDGSRLPAAHVQKIRFILTLLHAAYSIPDLDFPGGALHPLKGELSGFWAVTVRANWRIIFRFEEGNAYLVDYLDYH